MQDNYLIKEIYMKLMEVYKNNNKRRGLHNLIIKRIKRILTYKGYNVNLEYPVILNEYMKKGLVDLYAVSSLNSIGLEFDTSLSIKYKSINKLAILNSDISVFIVGEGNFSYNYDRIKIIRNKVSSKKIYFISLTNNIFIEYLNDIEDVKHINLSRFMKKL